MAARRAAAGLDRRPRAKDDLREEAVAMRRDGRSYREIQQVVAVSKSTLSLWLRDVPLTEDQQRALALRGAAATTARADSNRINKLRRRTQIQADARAQVAELSESELFVAGVVAYWAEGSKNKPWRSGQGLVFMNSDPGLMRLFLAWLQLLGVESDRFVFRLMIHESADVQEALRYWSQIVDAGQESFGRTNVKTHNPKTVRRNVGEHYHGCLAVYVRRSAELNLRVAGWCEGIALVAGIVKPESGVV